MQQLFLDANQHNDLNAVFYKALMELWEAEARVNQPAGYPTLFNHFNLAQGYAGGRSGYWGMLEYLHPWSAATTPPKFQAAKDHNTP